MVLFKKQKIIILVTATFIFLISIIFTYNYTDFSANMSVGSGHAYTAKSLALSGNFNVDEYWGNAGVDVIKTNNGYFLPYAPFNSVIMSTSYFFVYKILYISTRWVTLNNITFTTIESLGLSFFSSIALSTIFIGYTFYSIKKTKKVNLSLYTGALITLGTILFTYSISYFNHIFSALFIFSAFLVISSSNKFKYILAGVLTGLSFLVEFPTIIFSVAILAGELILILKNKKRILHSIKDLIIFSVPIIFCILILLFLNNLNYGGYFTFGEEIFRHQRILKGDRYFSFSQNPLFGLYGMYFSPLKGLFFYSPFLLFSILGIKKFYKNNKYQFSVSATYIILISLIYSLWNDCFGATVYGNRYTLTLIPFWGIFFIYFCKTYCKYKLIKSLLVVFGVYSILTSILNSYLGIADNKMGRCQNINSYSPITRIYNNYILKNPKMSPAIFKLIKQSINE